MSTEKKDRINWKKFITAAVILFPLFIGFDVLFDSIKNKLVWDEIWAMKNIFFKVAAALVGGYFFATYNNAK
jgi:nitrate reductase NapE component